MTYQEFVNEYFGTEVDLCDLSEEDDIALSTEYQKWNVQKGE